MSLDKNRQIRLITDTYNLFEEKETKLKEINLELNKDIYLHTNMETNIKREEEKEEREETLDIIIPSRKINKDKNLSIEIITSSVIPKGAIIHLTPEGYPEGIHYRKDGVTYFGYTNSEKNDNEVSIYIKKLY
jgi:hypothetical protein